MRCILPCSGYGTRLGMEKHQAKEMLPDTVFGFNHIIDYSLNLCKTFNLEPIVTTREEKVEFNNYLKEKNIPFIVIKPEGEWYNSVLKTKDYWQDNNIVILPDTRFNSIYSIETIEKGLKLGNNAVFAMHEVKDPQNWGIIKNNWLFEKPLCFEGPEMAWGLVGFNKNYGEKLFKSMYNKIQLENVGFTFLTSFQDITRK